MSRRWDGVSTAAKDLIKKMLTKQPDKRIKLDDCLQHAFFQKIQKQESITSSQVKLDPDLLEKLRKFKGISQLKKAALNIIVKSKIPNPSTESNQV